MEEKIQKLVILYANYANQVNGMEADSLSGFLGWVRKVAHPEETAVDLHEEAKNLLV